MNNIDKSNEELLLELQELKQKNEALKLAYQQEIEDFKRIENSLIESENRFRRLHESMTDCYAQINMNGEIIDVNQSFLNMLGYSKEEIYLLKYMDITPFKWLVSEENIIRNQVLINGYSEVFEKEYIKKDGTVFPVELRIYLLKNKEGIPTGMWAIIRDITERKSAEEKLKESENRYRTAFWLSPDSVNINCMDGKYVDINDGFTKLSGYTYDDVIGKLSSEIKIWAKPEDRQKLIDGLTENGEVDNLETVFRCKDGTLKTGLISARIILIKKEPHILSIVRDITEQKLAEKALNDQTSLLTNLIMNLHEGILLEDSNRKIQVTNMLFCEMFSIDAKPTELIGADCSESAEQNKIHFKNPEKFISDINLILQNKIAVFNNELELLDGRHFERDYIPTFIDKKYTGHLWKYRDITERKHAEQISNSRIRLTEFSHSHSQFELQQKLLDELVMLTESSIGFLYLVDEKNKSLLRQGRTSNISNEIGNLEKEILIYNTENFGIWSDCIIQRKVAICNDYSNFNYSIKLHQVNIPIIRELVVPIFRKDNIVALICICNKIVNFNDNDIEIAELLTDMAWDIIERKGAEENLKKISQAVEQSPAIIYITDLNGTIEYANPKTLELTGYSNEELIGQNPRIFNAGEVSKEFYKNLWLIISSGFEWKGEFLNKKKNGDRHWVMATISPIFDSGNNISHYLAIEEDISERKKSENEILNLNAELEKRIVLRTAQLAETNSNLQMEIEERKRIETALGLSERGFRTVLENVKEIIFQTDADGLWLFLNKSWNELTGFSVEESLGKLFLNYVHPDDRQRNFELFEPLIKREKDYCRHEIRYLTKNGGFRWVEVFARLGLDENNEITGTYGTLRDITERKRAQDFENELLQLSIQLTGIPVAELNSALAMALSKIGRFLEADRAFIFEFDQDNNTISKTYEWYNEGITHSSLDLQKIPSNAFPMWLVTLQRHENIIIPFVSELPDSWHIERDTMIPQGVQSLLAIPIINENNLIGFVELDTVLKKKEFDTSEINYLKVWANMLASLINNQRIDLFLDQTRKNYETFFNTIDDFLFVLDNQGNIIHFNDTVTKRLGYSSEELMSKSVLFVHPPERREEAGRIVSEMLAGTSDFCPVPLITKSGNQISVETKIKPGYWDGKPVIFGLSKDITKILYSEEKFSKAFQSNSALMAISGFETGIFIDVNDTFLKTLGYTREEIIGRSALDLNFYVNPESRKIIIDNLKQNNPVREFEVEVRTKSGSIIIGLFSDDYFYLGNELCLLTVLVDITERKRAEEEIRKARYEAEKANLAKSEFLSRMSHELRTPMNSILGFAQLMEMSELNSDHKKAVNYILKSGKHLLNLINEVLEISRIEAGQLSLSLEPVMLNGIILEMIDIVKPLANDRQVKIELVNSLTNTMFIKSDVQRFKQVLLNLLNNALKYNKIGGSVIIKTDIIYAKKPEIDLVRISITDTGLGIIQEDIPKLFNPFERIGAEKTLTEGTGLGLAVVKKLMDAMGGNVGVISEPGEGSTFWIEFPLIESQINRSEQLIETLQTSLPNEKKGVILYIEDNISNAELVEQILKSKRSGIHLVTSLNGTNAVKFAVEYLPDLILLDLDLPDVHGSIVLQNLLKEDKTNNIPVVIISADAMPQQISRLLKAGAKDYLTKPLDIMAFLDVVDQWI